MRLFDLAPHRRLPPPLPSIGLALAVAALVAACDRAPGNAREWTQSDHDQPAGAQTQAPGQAQPQGKRGEGSDAATLVEIAWQKNCVSCHGPRGRGDGPQGPMLRAPDLTRAEWQDRVSDQEMLETIRKGRNKMPAFEALPITVIQGLVQRIRLNRAKP